MGFSGLPNQIPVSESSGAKKRQGDYHSAIALREVAHLDINANRGFDDFINISQIVNNIFLSLHWLLSQVSGYSTNVCC